MSAIEAFKNQVENITHLLRAADVYTQHIIATMRGMQADLQLINRIINDGEVSSLNVSWRFFLSEDEYEKLRENGQTRKICEEIVLSINTAVEQYLISKFKEYLKYTLSSQPLQIYTATEKRISYRSLYQIKDNYRDYLNIHLPSFEPEVGIFDDSWFVPSNSWEGLTMLSEARNEIAHEGRCNKYSIFYLIDAYAPLDFAIRWVSLFNSNFDSAIYEGKRYSRFVKEHDEKLKE